MVFSSFSFLFVFLPLLLIIYNAVPKRYRGGRNAILLVFSLVFYAFGGPGYLPLMLISITVNYVFGLLSAQEKRFNKAFTALAVVTDLGLLAYFKYAGFFCENLVSAGLDVTIPQIVLPIGISFYTFQGISYVIDVHRGRTAPEKNPLRVALYIALFPQLIAGPIVRYNTVAGEISDRNENLADWTGGGVRFAVGLAKKVIIANSAGELADAVFKTQAGDLTVSLAWLGALAYTAQIYFDFSGYSDMAIGLGRLFGFHFEENFNYPYISKSITEFWRRWHISLSTWFRDYVYIPLGGNRRGKRRQIFNMMVVWTLTGFWHGAAWNFVLWGFYYFLLLVGEKYVWNKVLEKTPAFFRHVYAMLFVVLGWVLFRSDTLGYALGTLKTMFGGAAFSDGRTVYYLREYLWVLVLAAVGSMPVKSALEKYSEKRGVRPVMAFARVWAPKLWALGMLALSYMRLLSSTFNPFIYFRF